VPPPVRLGNFLRVLPAARLATGRSVTLTQSKPDAIAIEKSPVFGKPARDHWHLVARVEAN
jgi:hypothetical protein